eukprot:3941960-Rhodomonas_salina.1
MAYSYAMCSTDLAYGATSQRQDPFGVYARSSAMSGILASAHADAVRRPVDQDVIMRGGGQMPDGNVVIEVLDDARWMACALAEAV